MHKHFSVETYIVNPKDESFLFVKHKKFNKWLPAGGHSEGIESPHDVAVRGAFKETGLQIELMGHKDCAEHDAIKPLAMHVNGITHDEHIHMGYVYVGKAKNENQELAVNSKELDDAKWFKYEEIMDKSFETCPEVKTWCKDISKMMWNK